MKNITKWTSLFTSLILATLFTVFVSLYLTKNSEYKQLEEKTQNIFGQQITRVWAIDENGTTVLDEIYTSKKEEKFLADLMLNNEGKYKVSASGQYGRSLNSVLNTSTNTWVDGIYSQGFWWNITSPTYYDVHNTFDYANLATSKEIGKATSVGISYLSLTKPNLFVLTRTPV